MTAIESALPRLETEEGFRAKLYSDTRGFPTLGYGFNVQAGISRYAAAALLRAQLEELHQALLVYHWYEVLDPARQGVCLDIAINDGLAGLLGFTRMIEALTAQDWIAAASECHVKNPELAGRYMVLSQILLRGV